MNYLCITIILPNNTVNSGQLERKTSRFCILSNTKLYQRTFLPWISTKQNYMQSTYDILRTADHNYCAVIISLAHALWTNRLLYKYWLVSHGIDQTISPEGWSIPTGLLPEAIPSLKGQMVWSIPWLNQSHFVLFYFIYNYFILFIYTS